MATFQFYISKIKGSSYKQNQKERATMAAFLLSKLQEMLFQMTKGELTMQMGLIDDVNNLQITLQDLQCFVEVAEKKVVEDANIYRFIHRIKDVMHDIEDVLDEYHLLDLSRSGAHDGSSSSSTQPSKRFRLSNLSGFKNPASKHTIGVQIAELNKRLTQIMGQLPILHLLGNLPTIDPNEAAHNQLAARMTHSSVVRTDIVGFDIHNDVQRLVETLTQHDDRDNPLVCAIVGMGGIGKSTRAKLVFDDRTIKNYFDLTVWVCVSQNYDLFDILRSIIRSAAGVDEHCHNLNSLCDMVKVSLRGKRVFMVLDDVWEIERVWKGALRSLLKSSATKGSRVLVTTRNKEVAYQMMAIHAVQVEPMPLEDGWSLLCKSAFPGWQQQEAKDDVWNLRDIGMKIVKKCDGLPLAINIIGGMLSAVSRTKEAWELVLKSSAWEVKGLPKEVHSALYISYQNLPSNIKQCFLYCSLFPKNDYFFIADAGNLCIQEGLIKEDTHTTLHEVATSYFMIIRQRNLLMVKPDSSNCFLRMHDLVYSLAQFLMRNESLVDTGEEISSNGVSGRTMKLRHLSIVGGGVKTMNILPKSLPEHVSLRTLLIFDKCICQIDNDLFNHLLRLRVLWLKNTNVSSLPDSIGSLMLLRYLNLSNTPIRELPKTIENLKSLRILDVSNCDNLNNLPPCIMKLHCLCFLVTQDSGLTHLPPGLGRLNELQCLDFIMPSEEMTPKSSTVKELGTLTELRQLVLCKLERVFDTSQAKSANLKDKTHLQALKLCCSEEIYSNLVLMNYTQVKEVVNKIVEIFEDLCPPPQLKALHIDNYYGSKLPNWLGHASFNFLSVLHISNCKCFNQLNGLGLLPRLEEFIIAGASSIKRIRPAFYTCNDESNIENGAFFPRLKMLMFKEMDSLEDWSSSGKAVHMMPFLEKLVILECPKLKSFPEELLYHAAKSLKKITIVSTPELLLNVVYNLLSLEILVLKNIPNLERISSLPALQELSIVDCPGIMSMKLEQHLRFIHWEDFNADSLPRWFLTDDGYGDDNRLKAFFLRIKCKEELVRKICLEGQNEADEMSKIFQHFDQIAVSNEECLRLNYTKNPRSFIVHPVEAPEIR